MKDAVYAVLPSTVLGVYIDPTGGASPQPRVHRDCCTHFVDEKIEAQRDDLSSSKLAPNSC